MATENEAKETREKYRELEEESRREVRITAVWVQTHTVGLKCYLVI